MSLPRGGKLPGKIQTGDEGVTVEDCPATERHVQPLIPKPLEA
jgi:hypothetical protein